MINKAFFIVSLLLLYPVISTAAIYTWKDDSGTVHISDNPMGLPSAHNEYLDDKDKAYLPPKTQPSQAPSPNVGSASPAVPPIVPKAPTSSPTQAAPIDITKPLFDTAQRGIRNITIIVAVILFAKLLLNLRSNKRK